MTPGLEPVVRPNGKLYRPRRLRAIYYEDDFYSRYGVLVLGTHAQPVALELAAGEARYRVEGGVLDAVPEEGWWRDGFECGERAWIWDDVHGAAGLRFEIIA
jgi:hypothetical protein